MKHLLCAFFLLVVASENVLGVDPPHPGPMRIQIMGATGGSSTLIFPPECSGKTFEESKIKTWDCLRNFLDDLMAANPETTKRILKKHRMQYETWGGG